MASHDNYDKNILKALEGINKNLSRVANALEKMGTVASETAHSINKFPESAKKAVEEEEKIKKEFDESITETIQNAFVHCDDCTKYHYCFDRILHTMIGCCGGVKKEVEEDA